MADVEAYAAVPPTFDEFSADAESVKVGLGWQVKLREFFHLGNQHGLPEEA